MEPQPQPKPTEIKRRDLKALRPRFGDAKKESKKEQNHLPRTPSQCNLRRVIVWTIGWPMISVSRTVHSTTRRHTQAIVVSESKSCS